MTDKKPLARGKNAPTQRASPVDAFLAEVARAPRPPAQAQARGQGRVMFALDATMSRQPTWDRAMSVQSDMFDVAAGIGELEVQLVWFRGNREFKASDWASNAGDLALAMTGISCRGGRTQIGRVLNHALAEAGRRPVRALIYVGDACEEEPDALCNLAGRLGVLGTKAFVFHEGGDRSAGALFGEIARLTGGVYCPLDSAAPGELRSLLTAVAAWAAGGRAALERLGAEHKRAIALIGHGL